MWKNFKKEYLLIAFCMLAIFILFSNDSKVYASAKVDTLVSGLSKPCGVAVDTAGNVYIADTSNNAIKKRDMSGNVIILVDSSTVYCPNGVAVDKDGNVYIADTFNASIEKRNTSGNVTTLVDTNNDPDGIVSPCGVAVDKDGNVYIADIVKNTIRKRNTSGNITTLVSSGLSSPNGVAVDKDGNVYIADTGNNAIKKRDVSGNVTTLVSSGLKCPRGIAVDTAGNLYIADTNNGAIKKRDTSGNVTTLVSSGLNFPRGIAVDTAGNLYIADANNNAIKKVTFSPDSAISPSTALFDKYASSTGNADIALALNLNGNTLSSITNGTSTLQPNTDYVTTTGGITINKSYLNTLPTGTATLTFQFSQGADQNLSITVSDNTPLTVPDSPTAAKATIKNGKATIRFTPPTNTGGSPIIKYIITVSPGGYTVSGKGNPITITGLKSGINYTFTIKAVNAAGESTAVDVGQ